MHTLYVSFVCYFKLVSCLPKHYTGILLEAGFLFNLHVFLAHESSTSSYLNMREGTFLCDVLSTENTLENFQCIAKFPLFIHKFENTSMFAFGILCNNSTVDSFLFWGDYGSFSSWQEQHIRILQMQITP